MQTGILRVLRATAASWWRHKELRRTGQTLQAQRRERKTVQRDLGYLKQAASLPNAHVICGEGGHSSILVGSPCRPSRRSSAFPLATLAVARGTPFIDIRPVTDVIDFANLPRVARDGSDDSEPWGPGSSVLLTTYIDMVEGLGARIANDPRPRQSI